LFQIKAGLFSPLAELMNHKKKLRTKDYTGALWRQQRRISKKGIGLIFLDHFILKKIKKNIFLNEY